MAVVAEATHAREAVELAGYHRPGVLVAEAAQPDLDADDLCVRIAAQAPDTRVVLLCAYEDHEVAGVSDGRRPSHGSSRWRSSRRCATCPRPAGGPSTAG
jgi:CheY-like chemotaxis protein